MWAAQPAPERGISPSFIIGLVLLLFLMTADMSSWGSNSSGTQQVRLGQQQAQVQAQEVRDKLMYELALSNEQLEKENRQLHMQLLVLRGMLRTCRGGNRTSSGSTGELLQVAQSELALATGEGQSRGRHTDDKFSNQGASTLP